MKRHHESGFALLLVFVLAASIAIGLYLEMPRVGFESQRAREQLSIDGGLQYKRAVQLFFRKYRTYPQTLDDLETTRNIRFLRHRYKDPLTGKEYRLLHIGPAGQLTDSLIQPANPLQGGSNGSNSASSTSASTSATAIGPNGQPIQLADPLNMAARRPSDRIAASASEPPAGAEQNQEPPPAQFAPLVPTQTDPAQTGQPVNPGQPTFYGQPGQAFPAQPVYPGQIQFPGQPGLPDPTQGSRIPGPPQYPGQQSLYPGQTPVPGQPFQPQDPSQVPPQYTGQPPQYPGQPQPTPYPGQPGAAPPGTQPNPAQYNPFPTPGNQNQNPGQTYNPFQQNPGQATGGQVPGAIGGGQQQGIPGQQQGAAVNLIQSILTTPRQPPASVAGLTGGNAGGIVGVASNAEGKGIHKINEHDKYKEWEFVYDITKDKTALGGAVIPQQQMPVTTNPLGTGVNSTTGAPSNTAPATSPTPATSPSPGP
jgi:hypothetical protein